MGSPKIIINSPDTPPVVDEACIQMLFGVSEKEFIEKLARGDYGDIWEVRADDQ